MILKRIRLVNFRQFYGEQSLEIAPPGSQNVTLVHAENGIGKTTLLNSVLWAFFGDTTKRFEQRENILNFTAKREGADTSRVEVEFEHEEQSYLASRSLRVTPGGRVKAEFSVRRFELNGTLSAPLADPDAFINSVIPRSMAPYFFFDGEQAETFASETNYKAVGAAIRDILGCSLLENASGDLDYLARQFDKELGELQGVDQIAEHEKNVERQEKELERRRADVERTSSDIAAIDRMLEEINAGLRAAAAAAELQQQREDREQRLAEIERNLGEARAAIIHWIASKGLAVVSQRLGVEAGTFVEAESLRGRIPSPYNEEFVKNLLETGMCVCDRPLLPATQEWRAVQRLLHGAANAEAMNRVVRARGRLASLAESSAEAPRLLEELQERVAQFYDERRTVEQALVGISKKLEGSPELDIQKREKARAELHARRDAVRDERTRAQGDIERCESEIRRLRSEVDDLARQNKHALRLVTRREAARQAAERVRSLLLHYETEARAEVQQTVNKILEQVARRTYTLQIGTSFELLLLYANGTPAPKSGGENQLMTLAFIAALIEFARRRSLEDRNRLFIPATVAPLILDSPFGQLDDSYRSATAGFVPKMAPQVVLMVSSSQGKAEVIRTVEDRVGKEYVLIGENVGPRGDKPQDFLTINGRRMATTLFNCDKDLTRVEEITQ